MLFEKYEKGKPSESLGRKAIGTYWGMSASCQIGCMEFADVLSAFFYFYGFAICLGEYGSRYETTLEK